MLSNHSFSLFIKSAIPMEANEKRDKGNENCFIEKISHIAYFCTS
jgi:hypothetical protein